MSFEHKFANFLVELGKCPYDLPSELNPYFKSSLISAGFDSGVSQTGNGNGNGNQSQNSTKAPRKLSGYNLFMKEKMAELKTNNVPSGERMGQVSGLWKNLSDSEKGVWKVKAENYAQTQTPTSTDAPVKVSKTTTKKEGPTKLSGYQMFVKEKMPEVKNDPEIAAKERMGKIGSLWKALSETEQGAYKLKAEAENAKVQCTTVAATPVCTPEVEPVDEAEAEVEGEAECEAEGEVVEDAVEETEQPVPEPVTVTVQVPVPVAVATTKPKAKSALKKK